MKMVIALLLGCLVAVSAAAQDVAKPSKDLPASVAVSPKEPWPEFKPGEAPPVQSSPWWEQALLWVPNRIADLLDIFRVDIGVGPAVGGVVRVTKYGQVGYRMMMPASFRGGLFGRKVPVLVESSNEFGVGPLYVNSSDRTVCTVELGLGLDVLILGGYGGICVEEALTSSPISSSSSYATTTGSRGERRANGRVHFEAHLPS